MGTLFGESPFLFKTLNEQILINIEVKVLLK